MALLHCTDEGSGSVLVFLHGYCETHVLWKDFTAPFLNRYRVICPDLPGFGKSPLLPGPFTIADVAGAVWELLDSKGISNCFIVGHSLGGYVTMAMARQSPERVTGFCMFHSTAYADDENKKLNRTKVMQFVDANGTVPFVQTLVPSLFADPKHPMVEKILNEAKQCDPLTIIEYARAMRDRPDTTDVYTSFEKPVLFFAGMKDAVIASEVVHEQALMLKNKIVYPLAGVGHMGMLEAKEDTQSKLLKFLSATE